MRIRVALTTVEFLLSVGVFFVESGPTELSKILTLSARMTAVAVLAAAITNVVVVLAVAPKVD